MSRPAQPLTPYLELRRRIVEEGWFAGAGRALAHALERALSGLAGSPPAGTAVVATGGLGRGTVALRSDVDVVVVHAARLDPDLPRRLYRPLWDAGLKVSGLVHTPQQAATLASRRLDTLCALLTVRLVAGDSDTFDDLRRRIGTLARRRRGRILERLAAEERARRLAEPYRLMAADLKSGRGGWRTLDLVAWHRHLTGGRPPDPREEEAREALAALRSGLHAVTGRAHDRYDFELREPVARWLGSDVASVGRRLLRMRRTAEDLADELYPRLGSDRPRDRPDPASIPDWERLRDEPHLVPFHRYPVGDHTRAAVDQAAAVVAGDDPDPIVGEALAGVERPHLVEWAALLHDVGKGLEADHTRVGAARVADLGPVLGFSGDETAVLVRLVEHHLLLPDLATRFDVDDPAVVARAADRVEDLETLRLLYLLTVADSRATGSDTWSPWRAELVRRAYRRLERELTTRLLPEAVRVDALADAVMAVGGDRLERAEVRAHLAGLGEVYRSSHPPEVIRDHVLLARERLGPEGLRLAVTHGMPVRMVLVTTDRPGLLVATAGVMTLHRLSIVDARFATRTDGLVFDTFDVVDAGGSEGVEPERLAGVEADLARALRGGFDLEQDLARKRHAYRDTSRPGVAPVVRIAATREGAGRVEVECADRVGLLHDIGVVFLRFGMPVLRARVDTTAGVAYDTFFVGRLPADPRPLERALLETVG